MKAVLDACVLVPPVLRDCLLEIAAEGLFHPLWSARILEEWRRAALRLGGAVDAQIALALAAFPRAMVPPAPGVEARLYLPDPDDVHVLASAIAGNADAIITWNATDFPRGTLTGEGLTRRDPDGFLWEIWSHHPEAAGRAFERVRARAEAMAGTPVALKPLLKRAKLTRLARAVA